ncbi:MAG: biotin transporter BioY [Candidatus Omnitrophica bacterium]|nr:biotin transporter BioY [Candidatus Omnitrophota bacterium]
MLVKSLGLRFSLLKVVREILIVSIFVFLLTLSSKVRIYFPFSPVPATLQTLVIFLGVVFWREKAVFSQLIWIFLGILGLPFFSQGGGFFYIFSPTFGYILGFVIASLFLIKFLFFKKNFYWYLLSFSLANLIIYILGAASIILSLKISFLSAIEIGVFPFIYGDFLKIVLAGLITRLTRA